MHDSFRTCSATVCSALLLSLGTTAVAQPPQTDPDQEQTASPATAPSADSSTPSAEPDVPAPSAAEPTPPAVPTGSEPVEPTAAAPAIELEIKSMESGQVLRQQSATVSVREKGDGGIVLPSQHVELAGEMAFLTSEPRLTEQATRFSDVGLLRLRARRSFTDRIEAYLHTQLLAKQPSGTDESIWQAAGLGVRAEVVDQFAFDLGGKLGMLMQQQGWWWEAAPGVLFKHEASRFLRFVLGAGGSFTMLHFDRQTQQPYWLQEVDANAEVQAGDDNAAFWVAMKYAVPIASNPGAGAADRVNSYLDPQVRLGLDVGGVMSVSANNWDAYAIYSVVDRGDLENPATLLPILDGGFDQLQVVIGVQYQFEPERKHESRPNW